MRINFGDVATNLVITIKICEVGLTGIFVPFACKDAPASELFKSFSHATNTGKKIDESKV